MRFRFLGVSLLLAATGVVSAQQAGLTSSAVSDALEQLTGQRAYMTNAIHLLAGGPAAGPAVTIRLVPDENASGKEALKAIALIEGAPAGSVVVAVLEGEKEFALFGSSFAALAQTRDLAAFVVDGSVRDLAQLRRRGFSTSARGTVPGSAGGHYRIEGTNVPVRCGGIEVQPGDYVLADEDGIAVVPKDRYTEVLAAATKLQQDEDALTPLILKYRSYLKAFEVLQQRNAAGRRPK